MNQTRPVPGYRGAYMVGFVVIAAVAARIVLFYRANVLIPILLLALHALLYALEPWLATRFNRQRLLYYPLQAGVVIALSNIRPFTDISSLLYIPLCIQVLRSFSRRGAAAWLAFYAFATAATLMLGMNWMEGLALFLLELAAVTFLISYDLLVSRMQAEQAESERLLAALQSAHGKLQDYARQAEELAAARERNRLARELHDSISQAVFTIRLTSQSARILLNRDPGRVAEQVDRLQTLTGDALAQLRSLIAELRPPRDA